MSLVMVLKATCGHVVQAHLCVGKVKGTVTMTRIVLEILSVDLTIVLVLNHLQLIVVICPQQFHLSLVIIMFLHPLVILLHLNGQMITHSIMINVGISHVIKTKLLKSAFKALISNLILFASKMLFSVLDNESDLKII